MLEDGDSTDQATAARRTECDYIQCVSVMMKQTFSNDEKGQMFQFEIRNPGPEPAESQVTSQSRVSQVAVVRVNNPTQLTFHMVLVNTLVRRSLNGG